MKLQNLCPNNGDYIADSPRKAQKEAVNILSFV